METLVSLPLYPGDGVRMLMASIDSALRIGRAARPVLVERQSRGNRMMASIEGNARSGPRSMSITVHEQPLGSHGDVGLWRTSATEEHLRQDAKAFQNSRPWLSDADALAIAVETELEAEALYAGYPQKSEALIRITTPWHGPVTLGVEFDHWNVLRLITTLHGRDKLDMTGAEFRYLDGKWYPLEQTSVYAITQIRGLSEAEGEVHGNLLGAATRRFEWAESL